MQVLFGALGASDGAARGSTDGFTPPPKGPAYANLR